MSSVAVVVTSPVISDIRLVSVEPKLAACSIIVAAAVILSSVVKPIVVKPNGIPNFVVVDPLVSDVSVVTR